MTGSTDVHAVVDFYAKRGLLRNVRTTLSEGRATRVQFTWHYDRTFDLHVDYEASRLSFTDAFPNVPAASALYRNLTGFIDAMMSDSVPVHRRVDRRKTIVHGELIDANVAIVARAVDGDFDYAARKLIQVVNEIYFDFLPNSAHYEYQVQSLGLEPNAITFA